MLYYIIALGTVGGALLLLLPPRYKAVTALIVMTSCFDVVPRLIAGFDTWDFGAVLLLLTAVDLVLFRRRPRVGSGGPAAFVTAFAVFYIWMLICFACSLLVYGYPFLATLKTARQMLIGFLSIFVFGRLFASDPESLKFMLRWLYWLTFALLPLAIAQNVLHVHILAGTYRGYSDATRYLPSFLSFCLLFLWQILARQLAGTSIKVHEMLYVLLLLAVVVMSYTRGIYASVILGAAFVSWSLLSANKLQASSVLTTGLVASVGLAVVLFAGGLDRAISRFSSGVDIVTAHQAVPSKGLDDTFTGRLGIVGERAALVAQYNPFMGFGFIHDDLVPREIMRGLKYGSVIYTEEYVKRYAAGYPYAIALHSADAGWADMILNTGFVGLALFAAAIVLFVSGQLRARPPAGEAFYWSLAFFTQTMLFVVLMIESNPFVTNVQMAGFMIAGYVAVKRGFPARSAQPVAAVVAA